MTVGIYGIFDSITDECLYVGLSTDIHGRWKNHRNTLKNGSHRSDFVEWFNNHDRDLQSMNFKILEECENKESTLNSLEAKWYRIMRPLFAGKVPSNNETWKHSNDAKNNISKAIIAYHIAKGVYEEIQCPCENTFSARIKLRKKYCSITCREIYTDRLSSKMKRELCLQCNLEESSYRGKFCSKVCFSLSKVVKLDRGRLVDLYWNQELSLKAIAELEGVSRQTVYNKMKQFDIARREKEVASGMER